MGKKKKKIFLPQLPADTSIIDTHCHLDMIADGEALGEAVTRAAAAGVGAIITVGIDLESSKKAIQLAESFASVYATVGIHPHNTRGLTDNSYAELEILCRKPKVVAYGEIGLDYVKQYAPKEVQLEHFGRQVILAKQTGLPLVIHDREAHADILNILRDMAPFPAGGVMHCFSGDWQFALKVLELGFMVSIPGVVTFNKAAAMQDVAQRVPLDKLILETDAPFLAPEPLRGKKNFPEYILYTARKVADLRGMHLQELARVTSANVARLFKIPAATEG